MMRVTSLTATGELAERKGGGPVPRKHAEKSPKRVENGLKRENWGHLADTRA